MTGQAMVLESLADLDRLPGELVPDNPVKWAAYQALQHAAGRPVRVFVSNEDPQHWLPPSRYVHGVYLDYMEIMRPGESESQRLHVWMNPETQKLVAIDNMQLVLPNNYIPDPYDPAVGIVFHDTFTGLPK